MSLKIHAPLLYGGQALGPSPCHSMSNCIPTGSETSSTLQSDIIPLLLLKQSGVVGPKYWVGSKDSSLMSKSKLILPSHTGDSEDNSFDAPLGSKGPKTAQDERNKG